MTSGFQRDTEDEQYLSSQEKP